MGEYCRGSTAHVIHSPLSVSYPWQEARADAATPQRRSLQGEVSRPSKRLAHQQLLLQSPQREPIPCHLAHRKYQPAILAGSYLILYVGSLL